MGTWLERSGQSWKLTTYPTLRVGAAILFIYGMHGPKALNVLSMLFSFGLALLSFLLPRLVWCQVCRLHMESSSMARALPDHDRSRWLAGLDRCPACGDDGTATAESRAAWAALGMTPEPAYWSLTRLLWVVVFTMAMMAACQVYVRRPIT